MQLYRSLSNKSANPLTIANLILAPFCVDYGDTKEKEGKHLPSHDATALRGYLSLVAAENTEMGSCFGKQQPGRARQKILTT